MDIDPQKLVTNPIAAGIAGALVGLRFAPGLSWVERMTNVSAGWLCSIFVAPGASEAFNISSTRMVMGLAFAIGMFGMSLAAAIMEGVRSIKFGEIITSWISRK